MKISYTSHEEAPRAFRAAGNSRLAGLHDLDLPPDTSQPMEKDDNRLD